MLRGRLTSPEAHLLDDQNDLSAQPGKEEAAKGSLSRQVRNSVLADDDSLLQCDHTPSSNSLLFR